MLRGLMVAVLGGFGVAIVAILGVYLKGYFGVAMGEVNGEFWWLILWL